MTLWSSLSPPARDALAAALPRANLGRARAIGEGYGSVAFRVPDPTGDWSIRLARSEADWAVADLEREARLLPLLEREITSVETPRDARIVRDDGGAFVAAAHRFAAGRPADEPWSRQRPLRGARRAELAQGIAAFLRQLHDVPASRAQRAGVRTVDLWRDRYVPLIAETLPLLPRKSRAWLGAEAAAFERGGGTERAPRVLIHGDIAAPHLLLDGDLRLAAVIDFGDALVADPALDFAGILNNFSAGFLDEVLAHYGPTDPDAARRTAFYIEVAPIFQVVYGDRVRGGAERRAGVRRIAERAGHR